MLGKSAAQKGHRQVRCQITYCTSAIHTNAKIRRELPARHVMARNSEYMEFIDKHTSFKVVILLPTSFKLSNQDHDIFCQNFKCVTFLYLCKYLFSTN
jgi:hypothetical protein